MAESFYSTFWPSLLSAILAGYFLSLSYFFLKEHIFSYPRISGVWDCKLIVLSTAYNPYRGMVLYFRVVIIQNGATLYGKGEKYKDHAANQEVRSYDGANRAELDMQGVVEKNITKSDCIRVRWAEKGGVRVSSTMCELKVSGGKNEGNLFGTFYSTAGECAGTAFWTRIA